MVATTSQTETAVAFMQRAIQLARKGAGFVRTNPMVGSVLVGANGRIMAENYHAVFGGPHAERRVLEHAMRKYTKAELTRATLYVTLEPCCHTGKTPPCLDLVLKSGVRQVVIGSVDPNTQVSGKSIRALRRAGVKVTVGVAGAECDYLIRMFRKWITTKQPYVLAKVGMSLDGKITTGGREQYITNAQSLQRVHALRQEMDVIMVGVNTIITDNPRLNTRLDVKRLHHPVKVVLDSRLRTPATSKAIDDRTIIACLDSAPMARKRALAKRGAEILEIPPNRAHGKLLFEQLNTPAVLTALGERGYSSVLLEGGSYMFTTFINTRSIDEFYLFMAPYLFGATSLPFTYALRHHVTLIDPHYETLGDNMFVRGYAKYQ